MSGKDFVSRLAQIRQRTAKSVLDVEFPMGRARLLSKQSTIPKGNNGVLYWMSREQRVQGEEEGG